MQGFDKDDFRYAGPVKSEKEKTTIGAKAQQIAGVKRVDNQLEIAN